MHSKLYHRPHFTVCGSWNKSLHLQLCYCENSGSPASALCHATKLLISRNKWFASCGTSGETYFASPQITAYSPTLPLLQLRRSSFSNPSVASPTSQLILQPFRYFTPSHSSVSNPSVASATSQLILQPFRCFTYVTAHSPTLPSLHPKLKLIIQPFRYFSVIAHSPTLISLLLRHRLFTYVTAQVSKHD